MSDFERALRGWRLTTAKIFYFMPDAPLVVNPHWFLWQKLDKAPSFPILNAYLRWWEEHIEGKLHSVQVAVSGLLAPTDLQLRDGEYRLQ